MEINRLSQIIYKDVYPSLPIPVQTALNIVKRDIDKTLTGIGESQSIYLIKKNIQPEMFSLEASKNGLYIGASSELGFIYGLFTFSKLFLGVHEFWFWNNQPFISKEKIQIANNYTYISKPYPVKFRGWFINDEVLLHTWTFEQSHLRPWEMAFEALLRCHGNMVIPGTGKNTEVLRQAAARMGLYISHHHAEPLGAKMFSNVYPDLDPSYDAHPEKFQKLWYDGIQDQKDYNVVWNLGFRGQGDCPFWANDPKYDTSEKRGKLIGDLIQIQYDMVKSCHPTGVCCTNLYGEILELYRENHLILPDDIIKVWGDNGFGKMVSRRQNNHNPRIPAYPQDSDTGKQGIYYHVSFYDLQAANHITTLPNKPSFILDEFKQIFERKMEDYWLINCSNIKPHVFYLHLIGDLWKGNTFTEDAYLNNYAQMYFGQTKTQLITQCIQNYFKSALAFGSFDDEHAGEQFPNYTTRLLISQFLKENTQPAPQLNWALTASSLIEQVYWYKALCERGISAYKEFLHVWERQRIDLNQQQQDLLDETFVLHGKIYYHCFKGGLYLCHSLLQSYDNDLQNAFFQAGLARKEYIAANTALRCSEKGKWINFYKNECLTDCKQTAWLLETLMGYIRNLGDGPHFYQWQKDFLYSEAEKNVMLITNYENHLNNLELFKYMEISKDANIQEG